MDHAEKKKSKAWIWILAVLFLAAVIGVAAFWIAGEREPKVLAVETPYATLSYPAGWGTALQLSETQENGVYAKTFSAQLGGTRYDMFTLYFGETDKGNLYGRFTDEAQTPVYILCYTPPEGHTLTPELEEQFYAMADGINTVVRSLAANESFLVS